MKLFYDFDDISQLITEEGYNGYSTHYINGRVENYQFDVVVSQKDIDEFNKAYMRNETYSIDLEYDDEFIDFMKDKYEEKARIQCQEEYRD